ncbi:C3 and PZP-like alpha-2-macroglobulin domain-containing protein 8 [Ylistrum balloti]|uniref:C3 and PZP-like alpha-2-macroglobulin domain-containing protein 8 n=1 Tax=Ylistrum balloti TaxID=509963 RepID=UPI002905CFAB|nr:C3 and PZP-like alpha-2-macroglobulin domain-containing protein 8 [Ylistrum balloti]
MIKSHGGMLDCSKYRAFQIHWEDGVISLVRKCRLGKWLQILSWKDSHPRPVRYIGVTTGSWASSTWKFNQDVVEDPDSKRILEFETDMQRGLNYYYKHLTDFKYELGHRTSITFSVKACSDIHVALLSRDVGACDMYEVLIGGYANTLSTIRRGKNGYNFVTKSSSPADCNAFKSFKITWDLGLVTVWYESEIATWHFLMSWRDPKPINVRYIGMTTGKATSGTWKLQL